jgi:hypothetical protein
MAPSKDRFASKAAMKPTSLPSLGRLLQQPASVRHGKTGDTGDYAAGDVEATAFVLPVLRSRVLVISSIRL